MQKNVTVGENTHISDEPPGTNGLMQPSENNSAARSMERAKSVDMRNFLVRLVLLGLLSCWDGVQVVLLAYTMLPLI